ncbi:MAG: YdcF family protein [Bacilli bacterium]|nr:YdcF family protein [Bacilli bacterium]
MKLSNTNIFKLLFCKDINFLNRYVFMKDPSNIDLNSHYDIAIVFGCANYDILYKRADAAIELYKNKTVDKLFLTGGIGILSKNRKNPEAIVMKEYLLSKGVKEEDIVVECSSKYTEKNIINTLKLIDSIYNRKLNIVVVTSSFHMKRTKNIIENKCDHNIYTYAANDNICDIDKWMNSKVSKRLIKFEALSLYLNVKDKTIKDIEI